MSYFELSPAYGRDYKSAAEVKEAWAIGQDFQGDYALGFKPVNINDIPKPCTVLLRYKRASHVVNIKVSAGATARAPKPKSSNQVAAEYIGYHLNPLTPKQMKKPSVATMEHWLFDGVAKATDGCTVEPDGHCEHGKPSWLIVEGVI